MAAAEEEEEEEEAIHQKLVSMGFLPSHVTEALAATQSRSICHATDWLLHHQGDRPTSSPPSSSSPSTHQPNLARFFPSLTPKPTPPKPITSNESKRQKTAAAVEPLPDRTRSREIEERVGPGFPKPIPSNDAKRQKKATLEPLPERMRPRGVDEVVGQDHLLGQRSVVRSAIARELLPSLVLWGPPGTGKTSIARAIAESTKSSYRFVSLSAVTAGVKDVRSVVEEAARQRKQHQRRTVLFIDEVHRFNKAQLDSFLPPIEDGSIVFIGATTENPSFHLTTPLLSRCRVLALHSLQPAHITTLLHRAVQDRERGLARSTGSSITMAVEEEAVEFLSLHCDGDARVALNALEVAATLAVTRTNDSTEGKKSITISVEDVKESLQRKHLAYDRAGDEHYNLISALHKSMRGSDADASIYWLARMLEGGEQPLYIARRLVRFASEDVGLADPFALGHAIACYQACHFLGMPECNVHLAQCVAYLALAPKSVAAYKAIEAAKNLVRESGGGNEGVPLHLRNAPTKLMKDFGYGRDYIYPPDHPDAPKQSFLPPSLQGHKFLDWPPASQRDP